MAVEKDLHRTAARRGACVVALEKLPRIQLASDATLALVLAASLLVIGCRPTPPDDQDPGALPDPDVSTAPATQPAPQAQQSPPPGGGDAAPQTGRLSMPAEVDADARAELAAAPGEDVRGLVEFSETAAGVEIHAEVSGLEPGRYGFHVHEVGDCSDPGTTAGDHFSPDDHPHGAPTAPATERHAGDLGNLVADQDGYAELTLEVAGLELSGEHGIVERSVIVHEDEDDLRSQPSGDAGDPIACGVIRMVTERGQQAV